jgi:excisionase family DNA binding protein
VLTTEAPIQYIATTDDVIAQLRAEIFRGQLDDSVLCEVMKWSTRTLERAIANGLPHYKIGRRRLFDIEAVKYWVVSRQETKNAPARKRGRPRLTPLEERPEARSRISHK